MKKSLIIFFVLSFNSSTFAQDLICFKIDQCEGGISGLLINRIENEVKIFIEGTFCDSIEVKVNRGTIRKVGCSFYITPLLPDSDVKNNIIWDYPLYINSRIKSDTIPFVIIELDTPFLILNGFNKHMGYQTEELDKVRLIFNCDFGKYQIDSFAYKWIRGDSIMIQKMNVSENFDSASATLFKSGKKPNDVIQITKLWYTIRNQHFIIEQEYLPSETVER